jgi:ABC-2 type transport system permease protein
LRSRELRVLLRKDLAELFTSRAFWLLLILIGPLAGQSFTQACALYAEASGAGGGPSALAQGLSPLDGIFVPLMGAYDLAIMLLFPFVAIRLLASEKSSGALKLMLQWPVSRASIIGSKVVTLLIAWLISLAACAVALLLWSAYGGHISAHELVNLLGGYTLRFLFTAALSLGAAAIMPGAANAAIVVLAFTIGTWALDFLATGRGGLVAAVASFTPTAALRNFERGLLRLDIVLVWSIASLVALAIAAIWIDLGRDTRSKIVRCSVAISIGALGALLATRANSSFDLSENRRNSFTVEDERMLSNIDRPLTVTIWLAAEDPRMMDYSANVLVKLRRAMKRVNVEYPLAGKTGLFENNTHYGEIEYRLGDRIAVSRSTTEEIVLDTIYGLAGVASPQRGESSYSGYPLKNTPANSGLVFYVVWPLAISLLSWLRGARRNRRTG